MKRPRLKPDTAFRMVAEDQRAPVKTRLAALTAMARPSMRFLSRLASDPSTPSKLRLIAAQRLDVILLLRANMRKEQNNEQSSETSRNGDRCPLNGH